MVFPDGAIAKSGGHVIKNVAGYDLAKLCHGSLGTLGVVAELVLRVHPLPQTSRTVMVRDVDTAAAQRLTWALTRSAIEPTAVEWCEPEQVLAVRFDGTADGAAARAAAARSMLTGSLAELDAGEAHSFWESHAARVVAEPGDTVMRAATRPGVDPGLVGALSAWADRAGVKALLTCSPATGGYTVRITGARRQGARRAGEELARLGRGRRRLRDAAPPPPGRGRDGRVMGPRAGQRGGDAAGEGELRSGEPVRAGTVRALVLSCSLS